MTFTGRIVSGTYWHCGDRRRLLVAVQLFSLYITVWRNSEATSVMEFDRRKAVFANDIIVYLSDPTAKLPPGMC